MTGRLIIFEGPDGVGKTTLANSLTRSLRDNGEYVMYMSFPGREEGTVGELVYKVHHDSATMGLTRAPHPVSLQVFHVAAHIDAIETQIGPLLADGATVVLDRYWWSTWVYGTLAGLLEESLERMIGVELVHWGSVTPSVLFLVDRPSEANHYMDLRDLYRTLQTRQNGYLTVPLDNSGLLDDTTQKVLAIVKSL